MRRVVATSIAAVAAVAGLGIVGASPAHAAFYCGFNEFTTTNLNVFMVNDSFWDMPANWSKGHIPASNEIVCVPGGVVARVRAASTSLLAAQSNLVTSLYVEGTVRLEGGNVVSLASAIYGGSNLFNGGVIQVLNGSTLDLNSDQNGAPAFQNVVGGSLIQVSSGSKILNRRPFLNTGTINLTGGGQFVLDSPASGYSSGNSGGTVIGGQITMYAGSFTFDGSGAVSVLASGGTAKGTIAANQSLDVACTGPALGSIDFSQNLVNNGSIHFLPPLSGECSVQYNLPGGSTVTNNGSLTFGNPGVRAFPNSGDSAYSGNVYAQGGKIVNGPTGTLTNYDAWFTFEDFDNQGTLTNAPGGRLLGIYYTITNSGTFANKGAGCDVGDIVSPGTVELGTDCNVRRKVTLGSSSVFRPHWANGTLAKFIVGANSPIGGTVDVVVEGTPPATGATADVIKGAVTGTFGSVTSQSGQSFSAKYAQDNSAVQLVAGGGGAISAIVPARLLDSRGTGTTIDGVGQGAGVQAANSTVEVQVIGRAGVPSNATAAVLNITVTEAQGAGFVTVWPCGSPRPNASSLNFVQGSTVPNGVISKIGQDGKVCIFVSNSTQVLADVAGYFTDASPFSPLLPARVLDSRGGQQTVDGLSQGGGPVGLGSVTEVQVTGRAGVPAGAAAAVLNVTVTEAAAAGYVTVFPCGNTPPTASNLNFVQGSTVPNNVIAKIGDGGKVCLFASNSTHLIVDVNGYFATSAAFQAISPQRVLDSRATGVTGDGQGQGGGPVAAGSVTEVQITGRAGVPTGAVAAVLNVTVTEAQGAGYVTVFPCGSTPPTASNLNYVLGSTVPNGVIAKIGAGGKVCLYANSATHLIVDVSGYFTG